MIPVMCEVKHDPPNGKYGDCLRACIATIVGASSEDVPHFFHDNCDSDEGMQRVRDYLQPTGHAPFFVAYPGAFTDDQVRHSVAMNNPGVPYLLFGEVAPGSSHVVVCRDDRIAHDPAWLSADFIGPQENGFWVVMVIARL